MILSKQKNVTTNEIKEKIKAVELEVGITKGKSMRRLVLQRYNDNNRFATTYSKEYAL